MTEAEIPLWLKNLPLAPEYRPTETEFADPIAFISRIEREAASFGICKVIPPLPRPSKKFVVSNLSRSLSKSPELGATSAAANVSSETPVFTTRQQELGSRRSKPAFPKQVWQSGDLYTLEQFECKSKAFTRSQLGGFKEVTPLLVESLFWKAVSEKPIYIDYANDVPGSGFAVPEEPFNYISMCSKQKPRLHRRKLNEEIHDFRSMSSCYNGNKGISGWKLSNSPWNLQVIARSPGSLTRFMPDDVPGVTSPMVYIGMLFSWFAWHVEDHELHSMNFLHMGSPKTWYAVPQDHAATLEDIVRVKGYGESVDRLAAFTLLGEKTTLLSPEVLVASGVPCCRLVQHPGEFVVTFPRAYHVGFSHGFNCGEAANFATPEWLKVAKEAAIRRAAMNHLPMLSHQQLLYILTMSFVSRIPRTLISGVRSSRMRDRKKEEREIFVKEAFLNDMMKENYRLRVLLEKESTYGAILWEPGMLPAHHAVSQTCPSISLGTQYCYDQHGCCDCNQEREIVSKGPKNDDLCMEKPIDESISMMSTHHTTLFIESYKNPVDADLVCSDANAMEFDEYEGDLPVGLNIDSGSLACVSCGTLGYPFMAVMQPSEKASNIILSMPCEESQKSDKLQHSIPSPFFQDEAFNAHPEERCTAVANNENPTGQFYPESSSILQHSSEHDISLTMDNCSLLSGSSMDSLNSKRGEIASTNTQNERKRCTFDSASNTFCFNGLYSCDSGQQFGSWPMKTSKVVENDLNPTSEYFFGAVKETSLKEKVGTPKWDVTNVLLRPRIFCLQHAIEVEELLQNKGGGHIRIICHSDYLKFRGYASSIAEEVGIPLHLKDVPLENASREDLNLVNLSIDEEEHQEDGKDWTSKLGVNLKYTVKQRKISSLTQEKLPSALSGMFSSCSTTSVTSRLRWLLRKSRTRAKPVHIVSEKPHISAIKFGGVNTGKEIHSTNIKTFQVYKSRKKKTNDQEFKDHNHPVLDPDTSRQKAGVIAPLTNNTDNLFTVHISVTENHKTLQNSAELQNGSLSLGRAKLSKDSCEALGLSVSELDSRLLVSVPVTYNYTRLNQNVQCSIYSDGGQLGEGVSTQLVKSSVVNKLITGIVIETDSVPKFHVSSCQPQDEQTQETLVSDEQNEESDARFCLSAEDNTDFLSYDSEMHIEASIAQELGSPLEGEPDRMQSKSTLITDTIAPLASGGNACPPYVFSVRDERQAGTVNIKSYVRRKNKRKHEADQQGAPDYSEAEKNTMSFSSQVEMSNKGKVQSSIIFARSPCEGLRSRKGNTAPTPEIKVITDSYRKGGAIDTFECNIEGCLMAFSSKSELRLHKRDRCTYEKCGKRFSTHKYVMHHQRVHNEERPFKCPWKGCTISFKWEWARTEHLRVHTRERPYRCMAAGCGMAFRFVSDFSRHRRKTGHFGKR